MDADSVSKQMIAFISHVTYWRESGEMHGCHNNAITHSMCQGADEITLLYGNGIQQLMIQNSHISLVKSPWLLSFAYLLLSSYKVSKEVRDKEEKQDTSHIYTGRGQRQIKRRAHMWVREM